MRPLMRSLPAPSEHQIGARSYSEDCFPSPLPNGFGNCRKVRQLNPQTAFADESGLSVRERFELVDAVRGAAIAGVVLFHFVWDLEFTGFISGLAFHPVWLGFGKTLAGTFMFLVGFSLVLAHADHFKAKAFIRRLAVIVISALAISAITYPLFPDVFVFYGILHAIAVASIVCVPFLRAPVAVCVIGGAVFFILPVYISDSAFDPRWLAWTGFAAAPPPSNDFVPLFPWAGLSLIGMALAKLIATQSKISELGAGLSASRMLGWLTWMGRHSLAIYLLHQPILLAIIVPLSRLS